MTQDTFSSTETISESHLLYTEITVTIELEKLKIHFT